MGDASSFSSQGVLMLVVSAFTRFARVVRVLPDQGFGFAVLEETGTEIFFHRDGQLTKHGRKSRPFIGSWIVTEELTPTRPRMKADSWQIVTEYVPPVYFEHGQSLTIDISQIREIAPLALQPDDVEFGEFEIDNDGLGTSSWWNVIGRKEMGGWQLFKLRCWENKCDSHFCELQERELPVNVRAERICIVCVDWTAT
ncbi:MAG: hypothetical protein NT003_03520 [Candidatus Magasanikbacteria bacterium]|nr:hypothetical protein [Candidatus Magasanikbacteria bacterium]